VIFPSSAEKDAPICPAGPALPAEPPNPIVSTVAIKMMINPMGFIVVSRECISLITCSILAPRADGKNFLDRNSDSVRAKGRSSNLSGLPDIISIVL